MSSRGYVVVTTPGWPWMENIKCWHCVMVVTPDSRWIYIYEMLRSCDDNHLYLDSLCMGDMKCWGHMMMDILAYNEWRIWNVEIMWWWPPWLTMNGGDEMLRSCDDGHPSSQWMEEMKCWDHVMMATLAHNEWRRWNVEVMWLWPCALWLIMTQYEVLRSFNCGCLYTDSPWKEDMKCCGCCVMVAACTLTVAVRGKPVILVDEMRLVTILSMRAIWVLSWLNTPITKQHYIA